MIGFLFLNSLMMVQNMDGGLRKIKNTTFKSIIKHMVLIMILMSLYFLMMVQNMDGGLRKMIKNTSKSTKKTYGPYDYATFTFTKDNKAYIAYISGNELIIEEVE